ncbi:uncharacterized protein LOC143299591 [Babylonia areolata]|uniref:uncharacterized protein LOC143299591 n=1 Tax=Babylonia areolata TaxID=304850 RepID=UPI003FD5AA1F
MTTTSRREDHIEQEAATTCGAAVEVMEPLGSEGSSVVTEPLDEKGNYPQATRKRLFIKALRFYCNFLKEQTPSLSEELQECADSLDSKKTIKQLLFDSRVLLTEIPLRRVWLMVKHPLLVEYARTLYVGSLIQAKKTAEMLLEMAESKEEIANVMLMFLGMCSSPDTRDRRNLEKLLMDVVRPVRNDIPILFEPHVCAVHKPTPQQSESCGDSDEPLGDMSSDELYDTFLAAACKADWNLFFRCVQKGAKVTGPPPTGETPTGETPTGETPTGETPTGETPTGETPTEETPTGETPTGETPSEGTETALPSPLHTAVVNGVSLPDLARHVHFDKKLANFADSTGTPLLHAAAGNGREQDLQNVTFLLSHGADVNAEDREGRTVLQRLIDDAVTALGLGDKDKGPATQAGAETGANGEETTDDRHRQTGPNHGNLRVTAMMNVVIEAAQGKQKIQWRTGQDGWSVLHVLCAAGAYHYITCCVQRGADPRELRKGLTLIDTLVIQGGLHNAQKVSTLRVLLQELKLGPFHKEVVYRDLQEGRGKGRRQPFGDDPPSLIATCRHKLDPNFLKRLFANRDAWYDERQISDAWIPTPVPKRRL